MPRERRRLSLYLMWMAFLIVMLALGLLLLVSGAVVGPRPPLSWATDMALAL